jgi:hypothetical protein
MTIPATGPPVRWRGTGPDRPVHVVDHVFRLERKGYLAPNGGCLVLGPVARNRAFLLDFVRPNPVPPDGEYAPLCQVG